MKRKFLFNIIFLSFFKLCLSQETSFPISPYLNCVSNIKDGFIEAGMDYKFCNIDFIKLYTRLPITDKSSNIVQIDRFSSKWKLVGEYAHIFDFTAVTGPAKRLMVSLQGEYGYSKYEYFPTGNENEESAEWESSYSGEFKLYLFSSNPNSMQISPQLRIRYSYNWNPSNEIGVLNEPNANGISTVTNMVIGKPSAKPLFSPAFILQYYPGCGVFSYGPTIYYNFQGENNNNNPFNKLERMQLEFWIFYYPEILGTPNIKIGFSPFLNIRTKGMDNLNKTEYGGLITIKYNTNMLHFF
jgi:hypothetical protein